jgi:hypothetical protein
VFPLFWPLLRPRDASQLIDCSDLQKERWPRNSNRGLRRTYIFVVLLQSISVGILKYAWNRQSYFQPSVMYTVCVSNGSCSKESLWCLCLWWTQGRSKPGGIENCVDFCPVRGAFSFSFVFPRRNISVNNILPYSAVASLCCYPCRLCPCFHMLLLGFSGLFRHIFDVVGSQTSAAV